MFRKNQYSFGGWPTPSVILRNLPFLVSATSALLLTLLLSATGAQADGGAVTTVTADETRFFCGYSVEVTYSYTPDQVDTPILRGYSIQITVPYGLTFDQGDITVNSPLDGVNDTYFITENAPDDYTIDFTFLDPGVGLTEAADLFVVEVHDSGFNFPNSLMGIDSARFRTPENQDIPVEISATTEVDVICVPPPPPTLDPEPVFTPGTTNTLSWSDESIYGAFYYRVSMSTDPEFATIDDNSGWISDLSFEFTNLDHDQEYFFKVNARNFTTRVSFDSNVESSLQDSFAPTTSPDPLDPDQYVLDFEIPFQAVDVGSGFLDLELFYRHDGGPWTSYGSFADSPIAFAATDGDGLYEFYTQGTDIAGNLEAEPVDPQTFTTLDTTAPFGTFVINADSTATKNSDVVLNISVVRALEMRFSNDGVTWPEGWVPLTAEHAWTLPGNEAIHTVFGEFRDALLQVMPATDDIELDVTPPGNITLLSTLPGHEQVLLNWTNPADPDFHRVEVWRGLLHDGSYVSTYPTYTGSSIPLPPADRAGALASDEWELAGMSDIGASFFEDSVLDRGIYFYVAFAMDEATNFGGHGGNLSRSTNYILGDVAQPYDGLVMVEDRTILGAAYDVTEPDPFFIAEADVGPTDNGLGTGIPQPDQSIDFEDKMIFSMNYSPSAKSLEGDGQLPGTAGPVSLAWRPAGDHTWLLDLVVPCPRLKGVRLSAVLPPGVVPVVTAGEALTSQEWPYFFKNSDHRGLDTGLVILGADLGLTGTGTLLVVEIPPGVEPAALVAGNISLDLRDVNNQPLDFDLQGKSDSSIPAIFSLGDAYPNPFNPATTISFSIPGEMPVRLEIYGMDGRRVAVLVDETLSAGLHESIWLGRDDTGRQVASGVYFSKLLAGSQSQVRKLTLMK